MSRYYISKEEDFLNHCDLQAPIYGDFHDRDPVRSQRTLKRSRLHQAVCVSDVDEAQMLLEAGNDVNAQDAHGNTPLHLAITNQDAFPEIYACIIKLLNAQSVDQAIKNSYGQTAKDLAKMTANEREEMAFMFDSPPIKKKH